MKRQDKSSGKIRFLASALRDLQAAYRTLDRATRRQPWLVKGTVNVVSPKSPAARVAYTWTRKVQAKTITVSLSKEQAIAFRRAIKANRRVEKALARLRNLSHTILLKTLAGVPKRRSERTKAG